MKCVTTESTSVYTESTCLHEVEDAVTVIVIAESGMLKLQLQMKQAKATVTLS